MLSLGEAIELVSRLSRTKSYPTTPSGVNDLARGLQRAVEASGIDPGRIIDKCSEISPWCPPDHQIIQVAKDLARADAIAAGTYDSMADAANVAHPKKEWEKKYGPPQPFDMKAEYILERGRTAQNRHKQMWSEIRKSLRMGPNDKYPNWATLAKAARDLGYNDYASAWERDL